MKDNDRPKTSYKTFPSQRDTIWVASVSDSYTDIHGCVGTYIEHYTANERFIYASIPYDWYIKRMIWVSFINDLFEVAVMRFRTNKHNNVDKQVFVIQVC